MKTVKAGQLWMSTGSKRTRLYLVEDVYPAGPGVSVWIWCEMVGDTLPRKDSLWLHHLVTRCELLSECPEAGE